MNYKVYWNISAKESLKEILDYIIDNSGESIAFKIYNKIKKRTELLSISPAQGRIVPELKMFTDQYRELILNPWRIIYTIENEIIKLLLVLDGRRNIEDLLYELLLK